MDIQQWLSEIGKEKYVRNFKEHEVDFDYLIHLERFDLLEMGIASLPDRKAIMAEIKLLKQGRQPEYREKEASPQQRNPADTAHQPNQAGTSGHGGSGLSGSGHGDGYHSGPENGPVTQMKKVAAEAVAEQSPSEAETLNYSHLPYPAAWRIKKLQEAIESDVSWWDRVSFYKDGVEAALKSYVGYLIGIYLRSSVRCNECDTALLRKLARPSTGTWVAIFDQLMNQLKNENELTSLFLNVFYKQKGEKLAPSDYMKQLNEFVRFRNEIHHGARLSDDQYRKELEKYLPQFAEILKETRFLQGYPVIQPQSKQQAFCWTGIETGVVSGHFSEPTFGKTGIMIDKKFFRLEPFFMVHQEEGMSKSALMYYDSQKSFSKKKRSLYMLDYEQGMRIASYPPVIVLEELFQESMLQKVFNAFHATILSIDKHVRNFSALLDSYADFSGRSFVLEKISGFRAAKSSGIFAVVGEPGIGKTALLANLIDPATGTPHYFFRASSNVCDPDDCLSSLYHFLLKKYNIENENPPSGPADMRVQFENLLHTISMLLQQGRQEIIVIDAVDESALTSDGKSMADLIPAFLPADIFFIVSSVSNSPVLGQLSTREDFSEYRILADSEENRTDAYAYVAAKLMDHVPADKQRQIADLARWNFLFMKQVTTAITEDGFPVGKVSEFLKENSGLEQWYNGFWERLKQKLDSQPDKLEDITSVLGAVFAARDPVTKNQITDTLSMSPLRFDWCLRFVGQYLETIPVNEAGVGGKTSDTIVFYRFFHSSFTGFLKKRVIQDPKYYHKLWAASLKDWLDMDGFEQTYAIRMLPEHLHESGQKEALITLTTDVVFTGIRSLDDSHFELVRYWKDADKKVIRDRARSSAEANAGKTDLPVKPIRMMLSMGELFQHIGEYDEALWYYQKAGKVASRKDPEEEGHVLLATGWCYRHIDKFDDAIASFRKAIPRFEKAGRPDLMARCYSIMGINQWQKFQDVPAMDSLKEALQLFEQTQNRRNLAEAHNHMGIILRGLGLSDKAFFHLNETRRLLEELNDQKGLGKVLNSLGTASWWSGNYEKALSFYAEANDINDRINQPYIMGLTQNNLGYIHLEMGNPEKAKEAFDKGRSLRIKMNIESFEMMDVSGLARAELESGNTDEALALSGLAIETLAKYDTVEDLQRAFFNHALILDKAGNPREAEKYLEKARKIVHERADKIEDADLKKTFLEQVPLHREIFGYQTGS